MKEETEKKTDLPTRKVGLFSRLFDKLDASLKEKADQKTAEGNCCGDKDNKKGGGCC